MLYCDMCWNVSHSAVDSSRILLSILRSACRVPHWLWQDARFDQYIHNFNYKFPKYGWASAHDLFISACQLCPGSHNNRLTRKMKETVRERAKAREKTFLLSTFTVSPSPFLFYVNSLYPSEFIQPLKKSYSLENFSISLDFENSCLMYSACDQGIWVYW